MKEESVYKCSVRLKLNENVQAENTFMNENRQYFENLIGVKSEDLKLSQLMDGHKRVTFVRGIAGMGKTILAKQLACEWASGSMYTDFKLFILFECRELNDFVRRGGKNFEKHKLFDDFIETKCGYHLESSVEVMFVVDGLDELSDISTRKEDSIIWRLLDVSNPKYRGSRIIVTGRPHIESKLSRPDKSIGGLRKVEIQGLSSEQIEKYIKNFSPLEDDVERISNAKANSERYLPTMHIPQYLNTFCCVAILSRGQAVCSIAELYCWMLFLFLRQHADQQPSAGPKTNFEIFTDYSSELLALGKVCHKMLNENKIILLKEDIGSLLSGCEKGNDFIDMLFIDASDQSQIKYQFKHLSVVEFLSAFYICSSKNRIELLSRLLSKGHIDTVVYTCQLIARFAERGIIKDMLGYSAKVQTIDERLADILQLVHSCNLDEKTKFQRSLDIIVSFLSIDVTKEESISPSLKKLCCGPLFKSTKTDSNNLYEIADHLQTEFNLSTDELCEAFINFHVGEFVVNEVKAVLAARYLGTVDIISFCGMKVNVNAARSEVEKIGNKKCTFVWIEDCEFDGNEKAVAGHEFFNSTLDELVIWESKMNEKHFINSCDWGTSSRTFILDQLELEEEWWSRLLGAIESKHSAGTLNMTQLYINRCTPNLEREIQERV